MLEVLVSAVVSVLASSLALVVGYCCWFQWKYWDTIQAARKMPCSLKPIPILGNTLWLCRSWENITKKLLEVMSSAASSGVYNESFWVGPLPLLMITKLEDVQKILTTSCSAEKAVELDYFKFALGNGLLTAPGHIWKVTRRHISPLFHPRSIEQLMPAFNSNSRELAADLAEHVDGEAVNVLYPVMGAAYKTVSRKKLMDIDTGFDTVTQLINNLIYGADVDFDINSEEFKGLMKLVAHAPDYFRKRIIYPWLRIDFVFKFVYRRELDELERLWKNFAEFPFKKAKNNHANYKSDASKLGKNDDLTQEGDLTLIDIYAEIQKKYPQFTETDLKHEIITFYLTGSDTIRLTVSMCLLVLGQLHDIQDRLFEEINSVVGPDDDVTTDHISRMQYLDQVYKETLRWSTVIPFVLRRTTDELKLSTCTIPAGNTIGVALGGVHMDPSIYPEPHKFDPDRFSPENSTSRSRHAFIPFSGGSRMCIGKTYSDLLIKTMLVHVLRRFMVSTEMDIYNLEKVIFLSLVNADGYNIKLRNRK